MANFLGTTGADILDANTSGADLVSGGAGNDTLVYEFAKAGGADRYYGGTHTDVLELRFTQAEWAGLSSTTKASITAMKSAIAAAAKTNGAVAAGKSFGAIDFGNGKTVTVYEVESLKIMVDGVETDGTTPTNKPVTITSAAQAGEVSEDGTISASGTITFSDADLTDTHKVTATPQSSTALGSLALAPISKDGANGAIDWVYELNNSSTAVQALKSGQTVTEKFTVTISDGKGSTQSQVITVTITGQDEAPVLQVTTTGEVTEAGKDAEGNNVAGIPAATGKMPLDGVSASAVWDVYKDVAEDGTDYAEGYDWGDFTVTSNGIWKFTLNQAKADSLSLDQTQELKFAVTATLDGATVRREVTITVTGTDDVTKVTVVNGSDLDVVEAGGIANATDDDAGASGLLTMVDPDDLTVTPAAGTYQGTYGDVTLDANGNWSYALRNGDANVQALDAGQKVVDSVVVKASDGTAFTLKINVTGADDAASMSIVDTLATLVDGDGFLVDANGVKIQKNGADQQVMVGVNDPNVADTSNDGLYDNLVHEAKGATQGVDYTGAADSTATGKLALTDPDGGVLKFHALDAEEREDGEFINSVAKGKFGSFSLNTNTGEWVYTLDNNDDDTQALDGSILENDSITIYSEDGKSAQTITVYIQGVNDGFNKIVEDSPTVDVTARQAIIDSTGALVDVDGDSLVGAAEDDQGDADLDAGGKLLASDPEGDDNPSTAFAAITKDLKYGTLDLQADGTWTYKANWTSTDLDPTKDSDGDGDKINDADIKSIRSLGAGQVATETYVAKTVDGGASYAISVRLTGHNDTAVLTDVTKDADGLPTAADTEVTEAGGVNNGTAGDKVAKGVVKFVDPDAGESVFATGTPTTKAGAYGTFTLNTSTGAWTYTLDDAKANSLRANETVQETWELVSKDGSKGSLVVNVIGADDATTITKVSGDYVVKEAGGVNNATKGDATAGGVLSIADPDGSAEDSEATFATVFGVASDKDVPVNSNNPLSGPISQTEMEATLDAAAPAPAAADGKIWGQYGYFTFDGDAKKWAYTLTDAPIATTNAALDTDNDGFIDASMIAATNTQGLAAGQKAAEVLRVYSANQSSFVDLRVDITGANDTAGITNTPADSLVLQAAGFEPVKDAAGKVIGAAAVTEDATTSGTVTYSDPDIDIDKDGNADPVVGGTAFKPMTLTQLTGKYGVFGFDNTTGAWTYTLNSYDKDTRALLIGQKATDQVTVAALDGTAHTITVTVQGANNAPTLVPVIDKTTNLPQDDGSGGIVFNQPTVNKDGTATFQVIDGDAGAKLTLQVVEDTVNGPVTRDVPTIAVVDGGVTTVKLPTANSTTLYEGLMQVTDKTVGHAPVQLNTYLGMGTKNGEEIGDAAMTANALMGGLDGNDTLLSGSGNDYLSGGNGNDSVVADAGNDTLLGGAGNDMLDGGAGSDRLQGDAGIDLLDGGSDSDVDTFVFTASAEFSTNTAVDIDTVANFTSGTDVLQLNKALLPATLYTLQDNTKPDATDPVNNPPVAGKDGIFETIYLAKKVAGAYVDANGAWFRNDLTMVKNANGAWVVDAASGTMQADDRLIFDANTGILWYDADGKSGGSVQIADGFTSLAHTDIQFV